MAETSKMDIITSVSSANKSQVPSSYESELTLTGGSVSSVISISVETSQDLGGHRRGPNIANSAAENQGSAEFGEHGQLLPSSDEWDGEVVEEVFDSGILKFRVAWEPTLEPEENLSAEMKKAWEDKKARSVFNSQQSADGVRSAGKTRGIQKRGRPRKNY